MEQRGHAAAIGQLISEFPSLEHLVCELDVGDDFLELLLAVRRQHDVIKLEYRFDALSEL